MGGGEGVGILLFITLKGADKWAEKDFEEKKVELKHAADLN